MRLYLDSYLYDLITKRDEARQVRGWLTANGHEIWASLDANVQEALRAPWTERPARLRTIVRIASPIYPPYDYRHYREIADELLRLRPGWFQHPPDRRLAKEYLRRRKREWQLIKDPGQRAEGLEQQEPRIRGVIGRDIARQRLHRREHGADRPLQHRDPRVQRCIDARTPPDAHWRYVVSQEGAVTISGEIGSGGHLAWLRGLRWPPPQAEWDAFWMCDADPAHLPLCRIVGLAELFQRRRKVTPGNTIDRLGHAIHLHGFDRLITTDRRFCEVLQEVRAEMSDVTLAQPLLIDSEAASAVTAIQDAIR
jgi:hypothetical protein